MKVTTYTQTGEKKGEITLNKDLFGIEVNEGLMHQMLILQESNSRSAIAHTKTRGEIRGGGRKPHRQKGTGRARFGSIRTPIHRGGGIVFGPRNTRNFTKMMPKKQRRKALFSALSAKAADKSIIVVEGYEAKEPKTKDFATMIDKLPVERNALFVIPEKNDLIQKSARNITNVKTILANYLNVKDLLKYQTLVFLKDSLPKLEETFLKS
jgi:large subunit ribosomal protein L4